MITLGHRGVVPKRVVALWVIRAWSSLLSQSEATVETNDSINVTSRSSSAQPRPLFPWRHDPNNLPRLTAGTSESRDDVVFSRAGQAMAYALFLHRNPGTLRTIIESRINEQWRETLMRSAGWAFSKSVTSIIANMNGVTNGAKYSADDDSRDPVSVVEETQETPADDQEGLDSILGERLIDLYSNARDSAKDQLTVHLSMKPTGNCIMWNLICFPFMSRNLFVNDSTALDLLVLFNKYREDGSYEAHSAIQQLYSHVMLDTIDDLSNKNSHETTIELQVLVECWEKFSVMDAKTGAMLQGSSEEQLVWHLARFELDVQTEISSGSGWLPSFTHKASSNWKLVDIDDILGEKTWYQGVVR